MTDVDLEVCAICGARALFTDADPGANPVSYCSEHVPAHLAARAQTGQMPLHIDATLTELRDEAAALDIDGRSGMNKAQLQTAVAGARVTAEEVAKGPKDDRPLPHRPPGRVDPDESAAPVAPENTPPPRKATKKR